MEIGLSEPCMPKEWWPNRMNQLCKVCGEPAAGYHFGAFTCEGCKSFFGRTYNNLAALGECKNSGQCVINKKNRTSCKSCRLKKCLMVGMSKSGSRYGRRSNWFKIHCLIQDQAEMSSRIAEQHHQLGAAASAHQLTALYDKDVLGGFGAKAEEGNGASSPLSSSDKPPSSPASYPPPSSSASTFASTPSAFETKSSNGESPTNADALAYPFHVARIADLATASEQVLLPPWRRRLLRQSPRVAQRPVEVFRRRWWCHGERPIDLSVRKPCSPSASPAGGHAEELDTQDSDVKPALQAPCSSGAEIPLDLRSAKK
ncbi:hypothetical protein MRX96_005206 [Rhipicephalus microplus]